VSVARPLLTLVLLASMLPIATACGKKGPPLAPLRPAPALISDVAASRLGDTVAVQFTVPTGNADSSRPADLAYVDVYATTGKAEGPLGRPLTTREIETLLTRVGRVEVQPPPPPDEEEAEPAPAATPATVDPRPAQGQVVRVEETLTDAIRTTVFEHPDAAKIAKVRAAVGDEVDEAPVPSTDGTGRTLLWPQPSTEVARTYITIPYSTRGTAGPPSAPFAVPMTAAPPAPPAPSATHDASSVTVTWATPPGVQLPLQPTVTAEQYKAALSAKKDDALLPARPLVTYGTPHTYRVYEVAAPGATAPVPVAAINTAPLETGRFTDDRIAFGTPRCYAVRTVAQQGKVTIESPLSPPACITAVDSYPPPAPTGLVAVGSGGGVSLIWEPVTAPDLAGYLVLRGVEGEALKPVNTSPVTESTYRDTTAEPGVVYIYAVVAVDKATPANASPESNRVRESAR
jgi:fibronectin type 3 domain-containing protein